MMILSLAFQSRVSCTLQRVAGSLIKPDDLCSASSEDGLDVQLIPTLSRRVDCGTLTCAVLFSAFPPPLVLTARISSCLRPQFYDLNYRIVGVKS